MSLRGLVVRVSVLVALASLSFVSPVAPTPSTPPAAGPPAWLTNIKPARYVLTNPDLASPPPGLASPALATGRVEGNIQAQARAVEVSVPTASGGVQTRSEALLFCTETICWSDEAGPPTPTRSGPALVLKWDITCQLEVSVLETAELAKAYIAKHFAGFAASPGYTAMALGDPLLLGNGEAFVDRRVVLVRFRNCVLRATIEGVTERQQDRGLTDSDAWNAAQAEAGGRAGGVMAALARMWLHKVSETQDPRAEAPDLLLDAHCVQLTDVFEFPGEGDRSLLPPAMTPGQELVADKQCVTVTVHNVGKTPARGVRVKLTVRGRGQTRAQPVGPPVEVGEIWGDTWRDANFVWDLAGRNVEGAILEASAELTEQQDVNPADNSAQIEVSIWYAHNGTRAFSLERDTYPFANYGIGGIEVSELAEGFLTTLLMARFDDPQMLSAAQKLLLPVTYSRLSDHLLLGTAAGFGGHCYGMAATAGLYFLDSSLRPAAGDTGQLTEDAAAHNINVYHRAQMLPVWQAILTGELVSTDATSTPREFYHALKAAFSGPRTPMLVRMWTSDRGGHAVLAYKLIEVSGCRPVVFVYDSNFPRDYVPAEHVGPLAGAASQVRGPVTVQLSLDLAGGTFRFPTWMLDYNHGIDLTRIEARPIERALPETGLGALLGEVLSQARRMEAVGAILAAVFGPPTAEEGPQPSAGGGPGMTLLVLHCPADALVRDGQGRRTGVEAGKTVNEIPGARVICSGGVEAYGLPLGQTYGLEVSGTQAGKASLAIYRPTAEGKVSFVSFEGMPVSAGKRISGGVQADGSLKALSSGGKTIAPALQLVLAPGQLARAAKMATAPVPKPSPALPGPHPEPISLFNNENPTGAQNGPKAPTRFTLTAPHRITLVRTYHWNGGKGATLGTIGLMAQDGTAYGPWPAVGRAKQRQGADIYWHAEPNCVLPAGTYVVVDSDAATWSCNAGSGNAGFAVVNGYPEDASEEELLLQPRRP